MIERHSKMQMKILQKQMLLGQVDLLSGKCAHHSFINNTRKLTREMYKISVVNFL